MKSIPSVSILSNQSKRTFIDKILQEANLNLAEYTEMIESRTIVISTQTLTNQGLLQLKKVEHKTLLQNLWRNHRSLFSKGRFREILFFKQK